MVTADPDRARVVGFFIHLAIGEGFALGYAAGFALLDTANVVARGAVRIGARRASR